MTLGPRALLAKFDEKAAYRNIPIHPDDRFLLGMKWREKLYVDLVLPFSLGSALLIFDATVEAIECVLKHNYVVDSLFHYLDDFLNLGPANFPVCQSHVDTVRNARVSPLVWCTSRNPVEFRQSDGQAAVEKGRPDTSPLSVVVSNSKDVTHPPRARIAYWISPSYLFGHWPWTHVPSSNDRSVMLLPQPQSSHWLEWLEPTLVPNIISGVEWNFIFPLPLPVAAS